MKTKIALAVALGALFVAVPGAAPKGKPAGLSFSVLCANDVCALTGSGLAASTSYLLDVTDSCNVSVHANSVNTDAGGNLIGPAVSPGIPIAQSSGCNVAGWTFTLSTLGKRSTVVASFIAP